MRVIKRLIFDKSQTRAFYNLNLLGIKVKNANIYQDTMQLDKNCPFCCTVM